MCSTSSYHKDCDANADICKESSNHRLLWTEQEITNHTVVLYSLNWHSELTNMPALLAKVDPKSLVLQRMAGA